MFCLPVTSFAMGGLLGGWLSALDVCIGGILVDFSSCGDL